MKKIIIPTLIFISLLASIPQSVLATVVARTIVNPATNAPLNSAVMRNELQILENEVSTIGNAVWNGTGSTTAAGLLVGNGTTNLQTAVIGSGLQLSGTTLSSLVSGVGSIFGRTGVVTAQTGDYTTDQVTEGSNLYWTNTRFDNRLSATTTLPNITTLTGLSLPYSQLTGTPSGGSGTVSTSTVPTVGQIAYWTSNGFPSLLGSVATSTLTAGSGLSGSFTQIGSGGTLSLDNTGNWAGTWQTHSPSYFQVAGTYVTSVGATYPIVSSGGTTPVISTAFASSTATINTPLSGTLTTLGSGDSLSISQANTSTSGYLSSTDWNTFNGKQYSFSTSTLSATSPLTGSFVQVGSGGSLGCQTASGSQAGCLSSANWTTFNGKQNALGSLTGLIMGNAGSFYGTATSSPIAMSISGNAATVTNGLYSTGTYLNPSWLTGVPYSILTGTVPTWNQNTTGTASNITGIAAILNGGTGLSTVGASSTVMTTNGTVMQWNKLATSQLTNDSGFSALSLAAGTYTNGDMCTYASSGTLLNCNTAVPTGTVTAVSVASANGFSGTSSGGATPALTLNTSLGTPAGTFLAADPNGHLIATTTPGGLTAVGITTANGVSGTWSSPNLTISLGNITPTTINGTYLSLGRNSVSGNIALGINTLADASLSGTDNIGAGIFSLFRNTTGQFNTAYGDNTLQNNLTGSSNVALGFDSGKYETGSNGFYVNNIDQVNTAGDKAYSLLYGTFSGTAGSLTGQQLTVNGALNLNGATTGCATFTGTALSSTGTTCGTGTVTSVGLSSSGSLTIGSSPITTSGTLTANLNMANANTWTALQTFGNASTTQIGSTGSAYFATSGGNVGIGTTNPSTFGALTVQLTPSGSTYFWQRSQAVFRDSSALAAGNGGGIQLSGIYTSGGGEAAAAGLQASKVNATSGDVNYGLDVWARGGPISFISSSAPGPATTPYMTIATGGNVGIGTTTPAQLLSIGNGDASGGLYYSATGLAIGNSTPAYRFSVNDKFYITSTGEVVGYDATNAWSGVISPTRNLGLSTATTTAWTATTSGAYINTVVMPFAGTIRTAKCTTDAGTLNVDIYHTSTHLSMFNASTTVGTISFSSSNTVTAGEKLYMAAGTPASTPTLLSCTLGITENI